MYKKRNGYKKKRPVSKYTGPSRPSIPRGLSYDGEYRVKCHVIEDVVYTTANGHADYTIQWGSTAGIANNGAQLGDSSEFVRYAAIFKQFRLDSFDFEYLPQVESAGGAIQIFNTWWASIRGGVPTIATADSQLLTAEDFAAFPGNIAVKRSVPLQKYWREAIASYIPTNAAYPDNGSIIRCYMSGFANGAIVGKAHTTYYVSFRQSA